MKIEKLVMPLLALAFFLLLGGAAGLNWPFGLLVAAIVIHLLT